MAADERGSTPMKSNMPIGVHRRSSAARQRFLHSF
jgi:hypothetical protein